MATAFLQPSFTGGELSPSLYARVDLARYGTSLRTAENVIVLPYGGVENRAGFRFVKATKDSTKSAILIPFEYSTEISYVIELGDEYARFYFDGEPVMSGMTHVEIVTPWAEADLPLVRYTQSADVLYMVHPDYAPQELRRTSATSFSIGDYEFENGPFREVNTDEAITVYSSAETGTVTLTASSAIFLAGHVGGLFRLDERDLSTIKQWEPSKYIASDESSPFGVLRRSDGKVYRCVTTDVAGDDRHIKTGTIRPVHSTGVAWDGDKGKSAQGDNVDFEGVEWEYLHSGFGIVQITAIGGGGTTATGTVLSRLPNTVVGGGVSAATFNFTGNGVNTRFFMPGATAVIEDNYRVTVDTVIVAPNDFDLSSPYTGRNVSFTMGVAPPLGQEVRVEVSGVVYYRATGDGATTVFTFDGGPSATAGDYDVYVNNVLTAPSVLTPSSPNSGVAIDLNVAPANADAVVVDQLSSNNSSDIWSFGAWSDQYGYPREVEFFGDRLVFAATDTDPQTVWFTKVGNYTDFGVSNPIVDDDAISSTLNARKINAIRDLVPLSDLVLMTSGGSWRTATGQDDVLTPETIAFKPQSSKGAEDLPALSIDTAAVYVARGFKVRSIGYQFDQDSYAGDDLTLFADHLVKGRTIVSWAYQEEPYRAVWAVRDDGVLLVMTYVREQQVVGWSRVLTDGYFESVVTVSEGTTNGLYAIVRRTIDGSTVRYVERLDDRDFEYARDCFFVDSGVTFDGRDQLGTVTLTGSGFTTNDNVTVTASLSSFASGDVGDWIVLDYGLETQVRLRVIAYTSATVVTVRPLVNVPVDMQATPISGWAFARDTITGLSHLEGESVAILADGNVQAETEVSGGAVTLNPPAVVAHVGLSYTSTVQSLDLNNPGGESIRMRQKLIKRIGLMVEQSRNIKVGTDLDHLEEAETREDEPLTSPSDFQSGLVEVYTPSEWNRNGRWYVVQDLPLPLRLLGAIPEIEAGQ